MPDWLAAAAGASSQKVRRRGGESRKNQRKEASTIPGSRLFQAALFCNSALLPPVQIEDTHRQSDRPECTQSDSGL